MVVASRFNEQPRSELKSYDKEHVPVVIAVDTSMSVMGDPIKNINMNLNRFRDVICEDEEAAGCVDVCVLAFDDKTRVIQDWTPVEDMAEIDLDAGGCTDINGAVMLALDKIREIEAIYTTKSIVEKKPILIMMTDGSDTVTGNVNEAAERVTRRCLEGKLTFYFLGFGDYDRKSAAKLVAGNRSKKTGKIWCFAVKDGSYNFNDFFHFASMSVRAASESALGERTLAPKTNIGTAESSIGIDDLSEFYDDVADLLA